MSHCLKAKTRGAVTASRSPTSQVTLEIGKEFVATSQVDLLGKNQF